MTKLVSNLFSNVKREKLMSISNIVVMSVTFLILGLFIFIIAISQTSLRYLEQQAQITLFFKDDFPEESIFQVRDRLSSDPRISEIKYISKDEAFRIFTEINKDEPILLESISPNILPASLEIKSNDLSKLPGLADELSTMEGLEELRFFRDVIERFRFWSNIVYAVGFVLIGTFILISYSVVIATLRTTINSKGVELEIMKLVGASDSYVKNPLIMQGFFYGLVSSLFSGLIIILLGALMQNYGFFTDGIAFGFLTSVNLSPLVFSILLFFILLLSGVILGLLGSYTAVRRYLEY